MRPFHSVTYERLRAPRNTGPAAPARRPGPGAVAAIRICAAEAGGAVLRLAGAAPAGVLTQSTHPQAGGAALAVPLAPSSRFRIVRRGGQRVGIGRSDHDAIPRVRICLRRSRSRRPSPRQHSRCAGLAARARDADVRPGKAGRAAFRAHRKTQRLCGLHQPAIGAGLRLAPPLFLVGKFRKAPPARSGSSTASTPSTTPPTARRMSRGRIHSSRAMPSSKPRLRPMRTP